MSGVRIDAHCDTAVYLMDEPSLALLDYAQADYQRLSEEIDLQFFAIFFDKEICDNRLLNNTLTVLERLKADISSNHRIIKPLLWKNQLSEIGHDGRTHALFAVEGGEVLSGELTMLCALFDLGIRSLVLTWNYENELGGGANSPNGLTPFGIEAIRKMNSLGMIVDGAHLSTLSFWEMLAATEKPPIVSHTCCRTLWEHRRNLDDDQLRALAECGGVAGITFARAFLAEQPSIDDIVRHIDHGIRHAGIEHVGIGSDFDGTDLPLGMNGVEDWYKLADGLHGIGYKSREIDMVMGGNFYRVLLENLPEK